MNPFAAVLASANAQVAVMAAKNPEEAAAIFKKLVSVGLAELIAKGIDASVQHIQASGANANIAGWETQIGGVVLDLVWDRVSDTDTSPVRNISCFAPRLIPGAINASGVNISIGVSVGVSF